MLPSLPLDKHGCGEEFPHQLIPAGLTGSSRLRGRPVLQNHAHLACTHEDHPRSHIAPLEKGLATGGSFRTQEKQNIKKLVYVIICISTVRI